MRDIKAIGFDLFNTLIFIEPDTLIHAMQRMIKSLINSGFSIDEESYVRDYRDAAAIYVAKSRHNGIETHNSIWVSHVLNSYGIQVLPADERIALAVEQYFTAFYERVNLIPETFKTLARLKRGYSLGLLSNFTHGPAAREILRLTGLEPFFDAVIISGEQGYRKPHSYVFDELARELGVKKETIAFIGDDPEPDIHGASRAGLNPVWFTYVFENSMPVIKGTIQSEINAPFIDVPRAASWQELLMLLGC
ncbi:MAG: HAD family hydrolase [Deltaproteobacteria bacterium]|nr:HAD family hydrolase [Deltaproteobacteria bacterium]